MLIKQLVLRNFRVFSGTHTIDLAPRKRLHDENPRPIVLFGGLNGAGKTSIYRQSDWRCMVEWHLASRRSNKNILSSSAH